MGKRRYYIILISLFLSAFLYSCEKIPLDYRNKYIGEYTFHRSWHEWNAGQGITAQGQEITSGKIYYNKGKENKNLLRVRHKDNLEIIVKIDNLGFLFSMCNSMIGQIDQYTGHLSMSWGSNMCGGGALGGGYAISIEGDKK